MQEIKKIQLEAVESLTKKVSRIEKALADLVTLSDPLSVESQLFFIQTLTQQLNNHSHELFKRSHADNTLPGEPHFCEHLTEKTI